MKFYAFQYLSNARTTTGFPNKKTGRMNIAGNLQVFPSRLERDLWVALGHDTVDMGGNCRRALTAKEARKHCLGMSIAEYRDYLDFCQFEHDI